jgi:hypothetical protein
MGHVLRLLVLRDHPLGGTVEIDEFHFGAKPRRDPNPPKLGRGRKGHPRTTKTPALAVVQRPSSREPGTPAGEACAAVVGDLSLDEAERVLEAAVDPDAHLMSDEWKAFVAIGSAFFAAHDTVRHSQREYVRGSVHANSAEGFNDRVRARSPASSITSAPTMLTCILARSVSAGHSARWQVRPNAGPAKGGR